MGGDDDAWDQLYATGREFRQLADRELDAVLGSLPKLALERRRALDIGCGTGQLARALTVRGYAVTGVDPSVQAIERARAASPGSGVEFIRGGIADVESPPGGFELVVCKYVFAFVPDAASFLAVVAGLLAAGGAFVLITPDPARLGTERSFIGRPVSETEARLARAFGTRVHRMQLGPDHVYVCAAA